MKSMLRFLVERGLVVNLVTLFLVALGIFAVAKINREAFPNVNLDQITVSAFYPGATPEEVERLVITPIEQELRALSGINKMTSVSFQGSGRIMLELDSHATNRARLVSDVQVATNRARLPADMPVDPAVVEIDGAVFPVINMALSAPLSPLQLKRLSDKIKDDLLEIDGVARAIIQGDRKAELRITLDPEKMQKNRVSVGDVSNLLASWNVNAPGGDIDTPEGQKSIRIVGEFSKPSDISNLVLRANEQGGNLRLGDIATVTEDLEKASVYFDVGGTRAVNIIILKKSGSDIITTVDKIKDYIATIPTQYGKDVRVDTFQDFSRFARLRLGVLTNNGMVGLILVFISLILFLRPSVALTTTWGLPVVFLTGLFALYMSGVTLNLISMLGFIMVLGMLVDDAIIIGENITYHMERGLKPREAAVIGAYELIGPVTATVMTTIIAFLPMMFMSGIIGKFIVAIPIVVIALLFFSWLESFLMLPSHVAAVANASAHPKERAWIRWVEDSYAKILGIALRFRWITVLLSVALFAGSLGLAKNSTFQLFPAAGVDQWLIRATAKPGTSLEELREKLKTVDTELRKHIDPEHIETTLISSGQIEMDSGDPLMQRGSRFGQIRVIYTPAVVRPHHDALDDMHKIEHEIVKLFPDLALAFTEIKPGPPTGRALQVEITGNHTEASEAVAKNLVSYLEGIKGITSIESGLQLGDDEVHVVLDRSLAAYAGVNLATAANHVRAAVSGLRVTTTRKGTEEVDITIRFPETRNQLKLLKDLRIPNQRGGLIPLSRIARFEEHTAFSTIRHKEGVRVVSVLGNIDATIITSAALNKLVGQDQDKWLGEYAKKVKINFGGEEEKNKESIIGLAISFLFALVGIFFILAIQFNNLSYPLVVMLAIPFGAIGIIVSFHLHDIFWRPTPLSFFAMMGMVALSGVVVNSSLVLLVFIQRAVQDGMHYLEAVMLAGRRRLRAVILTATTTVVGLLPTAYGWGGSDPFVAPMALALSWGLIFATGITLVTIPATYAIGADIKTFYIKRFKKNRDMQA